MKVLLRSPAPDLERSKAFYTSLGFLLTDLCDRQCIVSDGQVDILLDAEPSARLGILAFVEDYDQVIARFEEIAVGYQRLSGVLYTDPNGVRLSVCPLDELPTWSQPDTASFIGKNFGFGIETADMARTEEFWEQLGYTVPSGNTPYKSLTASDLLGLTLFALDICPHAFYNPSLTYFNGKEGNPKIIEHVRRVGIIPTEEITTFNPDGIVDNIIIGDPGGLHYFLFND